MQSAASWFDSTYNLNGGYKMFTMRIRETMCTRESRDTLIGIIKPPLFQSFITREDYRDKNYALLIFFTKIAFISCIKMDLI